MEEDLKQLRNQFHQKASVRRGAPRKWEKPAPKEPKPHTPYFKWFLLGSVGFFILAILVAIVMLLQGGRTVSPRNIDIDVQIPPAIASGDTVLLQATITNTNPVHLPFAELTVTFPDGAYKVGNISERLTYIVESVGPLRPGESKDVSFEAILFGEEGQEKEIKLQVEFRPENSNAIVVKEEKYPIIISSAPLTVTLTAPEQVAPGESFTTTITVQTNSEEAVPNAILLLEYPFGFSVRDASPVASVSDNVWNLGTLKPGQKETIRITGDITGSSGDERFIRARIGAELAPGGEVLGITYMEQDTKVTLIDSQLALSLSLDGSAEEVLSAQPGETLSGRLSWRNNLDSQVFDGEIVLRLSGTGLDVDRIDGGRGVYRASDGTITFTGDTNRELQTLDPGERGTITFSVPVKNKNNLSGARSPQITVEAFISGREVGSGSPSLIQNDSARTINITSELSLTTAVVRNTGVFTPTGPWPPQVDQLSTYTVFITAGNSTNAVANNVVRFTLPSYVTYTGAASPTNTSVTYDERTGEMVWSVGELAPNSSKSASFQIGITPTTQQVGTAPVLIRTQLLEGFDRFVQETLRASVGEKTIQITDDPQYTSDKGVVVN